MDEPCSALDPIATQKVEELMLELKADYTIVIVTQYAASRSRFGVHCVHACGELGRACAACEYGENDPMSSTRRKIPYEQYIRDASDSTSDRRGKQDDREIAKTNFSHYSQPLIPILDALFCR